MTALPATMIGLSERGYLLPGMIADLTVFDPGTVVDRGNPVVVRIRYALNPVSTPLGARHRR